MADRQQCKGQRPQHAGYENEEDKRRPQKGAVAKEKKKNDEDDRNDQRLNCVVGRSDDGVRIQRWLAGELHLHPGMVSLHRHQVVADLLHRGAIGRRAVGIGLAGVRENQQRLAALEAEVFVLRQHLVGVVIVRLFVTVPFRACRRGVLAFGLV